MATRLGSRQDKGMLQYLTINCLAGGIFDASKYPKSTSSDRVPMVLLYERTASILSQLSTISRTFRVLCSYPEIYATYQMLSFPYWLVDHRRPNPCISFHLR